MQQTESGIYVPDDEDDGVIRTRYEDREYQELGTKFLKTIRRAFLTDDPGLGKTPQAIKAAELPAMVVAPKYLCAQWVDAIRREHPDAKIAHAEGSRKERDAILDKKRMDWYVLNLEMPKSYDMPSGIRTYINDESHHNRNRNTPRTQAIYTMENRDPSARIYNLTATPFWKTVDDVWMQTRILYPDIPMFKSYHRFLKTFCMSLNGPYGPKVIGVKKAMRQGLKDLYAPIMLGRTYKDVGRFLPDIVESIVKFDMTPVNRAIYQKLQKEYALKWNDGEAEQRRLIFQPTTVLHALRQVTAQHMKFDVVQGILDDNVKKVNGSVKGQQAVIGFWYKDHARMMYEHIKKDAVLITGDLDASERYRLAMWAQRNGKHIVASENSLAEGVNLSGYRLFIFAEEHYVPGINHQFLSRVVRDRNDGGKDTEPVRVFYVMARRSIDEIIHRVSKTRKTANEATKELLSSVLDRKAT